MQKLIVLFVILFVGANCVLAKEESYTSTGCKSDDDACTPVGQWDFSLAIGLGSRTNPLYGGDDQPILVVPQISYYGERFFWQNLEAGFTFVDNKNHMLNAIGTVGLEQIYFDDWGLGNFSLEGSSGGNGAFVSGNTESPEPDFVPGMNVDNPGGDDNPEDFGTPGGRDQEVVREVDIDDIQDRKIAFLAGLEYGFYSGNWHTNVQFLQDISGVHDGQEVRVATGFNYLKGKHKYGFATGFAWQSKSLLNYYYGLDENDVSDDALLFDAESGVSPFVKLTWGYKLSDAWSLQATAHHKRFDSSLMESPIVEEKGVTTVFFGGSYHF